MYVQPISSEKALLLSFNNTAPIYLPKNLLWNASCRALVGSSWACRQSPHSLAMKTLVRCSPQPEVLTPTPTPPCGLFSAQHPQPYSAA